MCCIMTIMIRCCQLNCYSILKEIILVIRFSILRTVHILLEYRVFYFQLHSTLNHIDHIEQVVDYPIGEYIQNL